MEDIPRTILVVDDEEMMLEHLVHTLKRTGCTVFFTNKGKEAVKLAKEKKPDLILLDVVMPDMDGGQVATALSECCDTANIPIIFLTGILTKEEGFDHETTGKRFVLPKPIDSVELLKKISQVLPL
jgi:CheY-like chemotaxis protein